MPTKKNENITLLTLYRQLVQLEAKLDYQVGSDVRVQNRFYFLLVSIIILDVLTIILLVFT